MMNLVPYFVQYSGWKKFFKIIFFQIYWSLCFIIGMMPLMKGQQYTYNEGRFELFSDDHWPFMQDSQGYIWGTDQFSTLFRFDGFEYKYFPLNPDDPEGVQGYVDALVPIIFLEDSEKKIWMSFTEKYLGYYDPIFDKFKYFGDSLEASSGNNPRSIKRIREDSKGDIWVSSQIGLFHFIKETKKFKHYYNEWIFDAIEDSKGDLWYLYANLSHSSIETTSLRKHKASQDSTKNYFNLKQLPADFNLTIIPVKEKNHFILTGNPTYAIKLEEHEVVPLQEGLDIGEFARAATHKNGLSLIGTNYGKIYKYDPTQHHLTFIFQNPERSPIVDLFLDANGIIWASSNKTYKIFPDQNISFQPMIFDIFGNNARSHIFTYKENICFFSKSGLDQVYLNNNHANNFDISNIFKIIAFQSAPLVDSENNIWISTKINNPELSSAIFQYNESGKLLAEYSLRTNDTLKRVLKSSMPDLTLDQDDKIWMATWGNGVVCFNPHSQIFSQYLPGVEKQNSVLDESILHIMAAHDNQIWIGYPSKGISRLDQSSGSFTHFFNESENPFSLSNNSITEIFQDRSGNIWIGTMNGLNLWDKTNNRFTRFLKEDGLPGSHIDNILEDNRGNIWIKSENGLGKYDRKTNYITSFYTEFYHTYFGATDDAQGNFYIPVIKNNDNGETKGLMIFHPDSLNLNKEYPQLYLTDLLVNNQSVRSGDPDSILSRSIEYTKDVQLDYSQNNFTIKYSALEYFEPQSVEFAFQLEGYDPEWQYVGSRREATYTNLFPGKYTLRIKAKNNLGIWSTNEPFLNITILPPWWLTWWAFIGYGLIIVNLLYSIYQFFLTRKLEQAETRRLRELDQVKTQLYTNITHEFRTPLTIISGMTDIMKENPKTWFNEGLKMIKRNSISLLNLVNQMLDLRKLESGTLSVNMVQNDILGYLKYITESFHSYAASKNIRLHFMSELDSLYMDYDPDKMLNIVSNLLSNAIKFTPEGGDVYLTVGSGQHSVGSKQSANKLFTENRKLPTEDCLLLTVRDTGIGISNEQLPHIFDRFYQVDDSETRKESGSGIGLALTKELVKLLEGEISVKSKIGEGTEFRVQLPITHNETVEEGRNEHLIKEQANAFMPALTAVQEISGIPTTTSERPLLLIIEDNKDVVKYLRACLDQDYHLEIAFDGQEGVEKALEIIPDIIISDVMMPHKDGFEVCEQLKNDQKTSHIPIILLTAKADAASRISGLKKGADAYLAKPFDKDELNVRLEQLILLRKNLQERYSKQSPEGVEKIPQYHLEDRFLQEVIALIQENLSDPTLNPEVLCKALGMSYSQLFRKLKALTGTSIVKYIRSFRLQKAKEMLQQTNLNVSEIAYEVGFNDPAYFSRSFQKEFGVPPSVMRA